MNTPAIHTVNAPALAAAFGYQEADLSGSVSVNYAIMGWRGKVWRLKSQGGEVPLLTPQNDPMPSIQVVILASAAHLSKTYYDRQYVEGSDDEPICRSANGQRPDADSISPQSPQCKTCPHNAWGSRATDDGKKLKACQDHRHMAIVPGADVENAAYNGAMLMRVPAGSLSKLAEYDRKLKMANAAYFGVVTKISFDLNVAYPKLIFDYDANLTARLTQADAERILAYRDSQEVSIILNGHGTYEAYEAEASSSPEAHETQALSQSQAAAPPHAAEPNVQAAPIHIAAPAQRSEGHSAVTAGPSRQATPPGFGAAPNEPIPAQPAAQPAGHSAYQSAPAQPQSAVQAAAPAHAFGAGQAQAQPVAFAAPQAAQQPVVSQPVQNPAVPQPPASQPTVAQQAAQPVPPTKKRQLAKKPKAEQKSPEEIKNIVDSLLAKNVEE